MAKKIFVFLSLFIFLVTSSFSVSKSFFSIVYGYTPLSLNDFNDNANSLGSLFNNLYSDLSPPGGQKKSLEFGKLGHASSFETEMRIEIGYRFEIGIIFTYFRTQKTSENTILSGNYEVYGKTNVKMTLLNPNLVLFYYFPLTSIVTVELYGGGGYYYAKIPYDEHLHFDIPGTFHWTKTITDLRSQGWGALAGITFEIRPISLVGLLLGARYRYVQMGNLSGSGTLEDSNTGKTEVDKGVLYYYLNKEYEAKYGSSFPMLIFAENKPQGLAGVREARLDLTGFTFLIGLRFWF